MYTVAVFDDDAQMLDLMLNMLKSGGVSAIGESDIGKLNAILGEHDSIGVLVVDVWHHNQAVFDVLEASAELFASKKLVVISGGGPVSIEMSAAIAQFSRPDEFLSKPFTKQQLLDAVAH